MSSARKKRFRKVRILKLEREAKGIPVKWVREMDCGPPQRPPFQGLEQKSKMCRASGTSGWMHSFSLRPVTSKVGN